MWSLCTNIFSTSMFGIIDNNSKYDVSEDKIDTSYWQERMTYNLNVTSKLRGEDIFTYRYSEVYEGYFVSLTMDAKKLFADIPRAKVNVTLDLASDYFKDKNMTIVGKFKLRKFICLKKIQSIF